MQKTIQTTGQVLKVKEGYNPNSSSMGSTIPIFLACLSGAGAAVVIGLHTLEAMRERMLAKKEDLTPHACEKQDV